MDDPSNRVLDTAIDCLKSFQSECIQRLTRMEENLRLLRQDLLGDAQPGRIARLEADVGQLRAEYHRQRGVFAAISFVISAAVAIFSRFLGH